MEVKLKAKITVPVLSRQYELRAGKLILKTKIGFKTLSGLKTPQLVINQRESASKDVVNSSLNKTSLSIPSGMRNAW